MAHFIWVSDEDVLNLDQVISIVFYDESTWEQNGRRTKDYDDLDPSQPIVEVNKFKVALVKTGPLVTKTFRYTGPRAERIFEAMKHQASAW